MASIVITLSKEEHDNFVRLCKAFDIKRSRLAKQLYNIGEAAFERSLLVAACECRQKEP